MCSNLKIAAHDYCTRVLPGVDVMNGVVMFGIFLATPTVQVHARWSTRVVIYYTCVVIYHRCVVITYRCVVIWR